MPRYFVQLSYKGTNYQGWQVQAHTKATVQEILNEKLAMLLREKVDCTGCGRTDSGVHAKDFFAHFDSSNEKLYGDDDFVYHLNCVLPEDIAVKKIFSVKADAHARYDAISRSYEYHITSEKDPFNDHLAWEMRDEIDMSTMNDAAKIILQYDDFGAFCKSGSDVKTTICNVSFCEWKFDGKHLVFHITANRFLRNMVRAIVGTLLDAGREKISVDDMHRIIKSGSRSEAGQSVPAHGLYLSQVKYPYELK